MGKLNSVLSFKLQLQKTMPVEINYKMWLCTQYLLNISYSCFVKRGYFAPLLIEECFFLNLIYHRITFQRIDNGKYVK